MKCTALPSGQATADLVAGDVDAVGRVALCTLGRAVLLGAGMLVAGKRENLVRDAIAGAVGIEAFVIGWAVWRRGQAR